MVNGTIGFTTYTNYSLANFTEISNVTEFPDLMININHIIYDGWLYFILLWVFWFIIFRKAQSYEDDILKNITITGAIITVISLFMRGIEMAKSGVIYGLLTDHQLWIFPLLTIFFAVLTYSTNKD